MICPRCKFSFFTRKYSIGGTKPVERKVTCPYCLNNFVAPLRTDARRAIKEILTDDLFDTDEWRNADIVKRVQILVDQIKSTR